MAELMDFAAPAISSAYASKYEATLAYGAAGNFTEQSASDATA
jgi:hypothetical protein